MPPFTTPVFVHILSIVVEITPSRLDSAVQKLEHRRLSPMMTLEAFERPFSPPDLLRSLGDRSTSAFSWDIALATKITRPNPFAKV
jgi:hypothetical protein